MDGTPPLSLGHVQKAGAQLDYPPTAPQAPTPTPTGGSRARLAWTTPVGMSFRAAGHALSDHVGRARLDRERSGGPVRAERTKRTGPISGGRLP
jgi:hypothetical protein